MREVSNFATPARALVAAALAALVALAALAAAPGAEAKAKNKSVNVKVMTRNIFLGADLSPALAANSFPEFTAANDGILDEVDETNFPLRAQGLAAEFKQKKPDLIGLQEVAWWRTAATPGAPAQGPEGVFTATQTRFDFLQILLDEMEARGLDYKPVVTKTEFDFEAPADTDDNPATGLFGGDIQGRLTMRDVILVNKDSKVDAKAKNAQSGTYENLYTPNISGIDVPVTRGWTAADVTVSKGKGKHEVKRKFRFVNTHFEAFDDETQVPSIRSLQASEVLAAAANKQRTILLGDFNSNVPPVQPGDEQAYQTLLDGGFSERGVHEPVTCCVSNLFTSPQSEFDHQVDHIMSNTNKIKLVDSSATGREQANGVYNSDHAGVFSVLKLK